MPKDNIDEKLLRFAYKLAFRDATMRKAFRKRDGEDDNAFRQRKNQIYDSAYEYVEEYVNTVFFQQNHKQIIRLITKDSIESDK